jgi:DNA-3-methyladenine glycosylase II
MLNTQGDLEAAIRAVVAADPRLHPVLERVGMPALRRRPAGFAGLALIVVGQQLSTASAAAIWARLTGALGSVEPEAVLETADDALGRLGLSRAKIRSLKAIATEIADERLALNQLAGMAADAAHAALTRLPGIGPWTADVYLLFCLGNADAWPAGDLAVQEGVRAGLGLAHRPGTKEMADLAEPWQPFRGAAAHLWWDYYRHTRRREGALA